LYDHDGVQPGRLLGQQGHERPVERLGVWRDVVVDRAEVVHGGLREHDQVGCGTGVLSHPVEPRPHGLPLGLGVGAGSRLHERDLHCVGIGSGKGRGVGHAPMLAPLPDSGACR
jgi:hypothetical protein